MPTTERKDARNAATFQEARNQVGGAIGKDFHGATPLMSGLN
jgi:hypothetical protein